MIVVIQHLQENHHRNKFRRIHFRTYNDIFSIYLDEKSQTVFAGDSGSILKQFSLVTHKMIKLFKDIGLGRVFSVSSFNGILCVAGDDKFQLIDIKNRQVLMKSSFNTSIGCLLTSQFYTVVKNHKSKVRLFISGGNSVFKFFEKDI